MGVIRIADGVYSVGVLNPNMRVFDVVMKTGYGTSYNAYLITGEKNVLIDTVHVRFFDEYLENIRSIIDPSKIDCLIMNHNEPDHSGSIAKLFEVAPQLQVLSTPGGKIYLGPITNTPSLRANAVKDGETLDIGGGRTLQFFHAPFLHWPDSMFTWLGSEKLAFTCDFLGTHYCEPRMFDSLVAYPAAYESEFKGYYDAIFGPFKSYVQKGLAILSTLGAELVCTSHGPILTKGGYLETAMARYDGWSRPAEQTVKTVPIFYCSAYGNTGRLAATIAEGILSVQKDVVVTVYDVNEHDIGCLKSIMNEADAFLLGSPTINRDAVPPIWELACAVDAINSKNKPVAVFGSYGWSGEAVPGLIARLKALKMAVFEEGYVSRFVPSEGELSAAFDFGARFAGTL